ncbi:TetR/AcrR family transcriptional regulator [Nocardioides sp. NPDC023903]|uniref:TetR/AcrR family transcriptional regulator n=1 Tax=Nocardioides sp. NPDC023903 TaxID=3157195 RepID=UPI0033D166BB
MPAAKSKDPTRIPPRERLMSAAELFYTDGIRAVGVNRVLEEAGTPIMSLYRLFGSKEGLVEAYLRNRDENTRAMFEREIDKRASTGKEKVLAVFDVLDLLVSADDYRGCAFVNVAVEMADPHHPFVDIAAAHKDFVRTAFAGYLADAGIEQTEPLATQLLMLMDGVFVGAQMQAHRKDHARHARAAAESLVDAALAAQHARVAS